MSRRRAAAALGALILSISASSVLGAETWGDYSNARFDFRISYPTSLFALERTTPAGDGHIFHAPSQDARLLVGVLVNSDRFTSEQYIKYVEATSYAGFAVTYRKTGSGWLAISGKKDDKIFYEKVQFSCGGNLISSFAVIYPAANQSTIGPIIERMENSFRSARNCAAAEAR